MCPFGSSFLKTTLGISDVVFRLLPAGCNRGISSFPFLFNIEKTKKKELAGVWWLVSTSQFDRPEFVEAHVDDPIRLSGVLVEARIDIPIRPDRVR